MANLALLRHGQSQWNLENRFTGWTDVPLTEKGRAEAKEAGVKMKIAGLHFDLAFTSILQRAGDTLELALEEMDQLGLRIERDQALNERHYGDLQGLNKADTAKKFGDEQVKVWRRSYDIAPPGGESLENTAQRTLPYLKQTILTQVLAGHHVLVAAHGNSLRSIIMHLDALDPTEIVNLEIGTGVPMIYDIDNQGDVISKTTLE